MAVTEAQHEDRTGRPTTPAAILFDNFGPYHLARLRAARAALPLTGIEVGGESDDYPWFSGGAEETELVRLFPGTSSSAVGRAELRRRLWDALDRVDPAVVAVPGWSAPAALLAIAWCGARRRRVVMMCDSTVLDAPRFAPVEEVKRLILATCAAGFVSGTRSREYFVRLGMADARVSLGYDVVDNAHFAAGAAAVRADPHAERARLGLPPAYILALGRLVEKKNFARLIDAYALYRTRAGSEALPLVIAGDGDLRKPLTARRDALGLTDAVHFAGLVGYADLPAYYALARAFVLPSTVEQWGLVVNEAAACGVPLVVSSRAGAYPDLLREGANGRGCDPFDPNSIAEAVHTVCHLDDCTGQSAASSAVAAQWGLDRFVTGLGRAIEQAASGRPPGGIGMLAVNAMARR